MTFAFLFDEARLCAISIFFVQSSSEMSEPSGFIAARWNTKSAFFRYGERSSFAISHLIYRTVFEFTRPFVSRMSASTLRSPFSILFNRYEPRKPPLPVTTIFVLGRIIFASFLEHLDMPLHFIERGKNGMAVHPADPNQVFGKGIHLFLDLRIGFVKGEFYEDIGHVEARSGEKLVGREESSRIDLRVIRNARCIVGKINAHNAVGLVGDRQDGLFGDLVHQGVRDGHGSAGRSGNARRGDLRQFPVEPFPGLGDDELSVFPNRLPRDGLRREIFSRGEFPPAAFEVDPGFCLAERFGEKRSSAARSLYFSHPYFFSERPESGLKIIGDVQKHRLRLREAFSLPALVAFELIFADSYGLLVGKKIVRFELLPVL